MPADDARSMSQNNTSSVSDVARLFALQKKAYAENPFPSYDRRIANLDKIIRLIEVNEEKFVEAVSADFGNRSPHETKLAEIMIASSGAKLAKKNLQRWMRPRGVPTPVQFLPAKSRIEPQPLGVVGIIAPWNYPLELSLAPAAAALAAGNRVMIKPSELTPQISEALREAIAAEFDEDECAVITGGVEIGEAFSQTPFDHLFFTGSPAVGRIVAEAAARNLTPVTLELGGKSPAIIHESADMASTVRSIAHGKMLNAGQTCVAPDYVLTPPDKLEETIEGVANAANRLFPEINNTPDYTSIVSDRHFNRLKDLIEEARESGARIIEVGDKDALHAERKLPLTLIIDPPENIRAMQEELFGPVLLIIPVSSNDAAINYVNERERPLALYWFGEDTAVRDEALQRTVSGGVTVGDTLLQFAQENLPFGGVGNSGVGAYHGESGFETFSHMKSVFYQSRFSNSNLLHPPYTEKTDKLLSLIRKIF